MKRDSEKAEWDCQLEEGAVNNWA